MTASKKPNGGAQREESRRLQERAEQVMPGGVNSPRRSFAAVGGVPPFVVKGRGARVWDADGREYLDYAGGAPLILGHAFPDVVEAVRTAAGLGASFAASTAAEVELAELVVDAYTPLEMVRFTASATEATMAAIRLARAFTRRKYIVLFEGCRHGDGDAVADSRSLDPAAAGLPEEVAKLRLVLPYNDVEAVESKFGELGGQVACAVVQPVATGMGCVPADPLFLDAVRAATSRHGALLILDEVATGFRLSYRGSLERYGAMPDLAIFGNVIGGGLPVGAYGGSREVMSLVAPLGAVHQGDALSGNPLAMAAGLVTLRRLKKYPDIYEQLEGSAATLVKGVLQAAAEAGVPLSANRAGSLFTWFFNPGRVTSRVTASPSDVERYRKFHQSMMEQGVWLPPTQFEAACLGAGHSRDDIAATVEAARLALQQL